MMWYRALNANFNRHLKNYTIIGKKQPVKSLRSGPHPHYRFFTYTDGIFENWQYVIMFSPATQELRPLAFHHTYLMTSSLPLSLINYFQPITFPIFFARSFWKSLHPFYPLFQTWKDNIYRTWGRIATSKTYLRLRFRGKGYYLYKSKRNSLSFRFGFSHRVYRYPGSVWYRLLSKTEIFIWGYYFYPIWTFAWSIKKIRPHNQYTGKGIRFSRQITYKKLGKVGSYR